MKETRSTSPFTVPFTQLVNGVVGKVDVACGATIKLERGKTLGWAGVTATFGSLWLPKTIVGSLQPANRRVLCLRSVLPVSR